MWCAPEMNCVCDYDAMHCAQWLRKGRGRRRYRGSKIHLNTFAFPLTRPIICGHYTHWLESLPSESSWTSTWHLELQCKYFISPQLAPLHLRQWRHLLLVIISLFNCTQKLYLHWIWIRRPRLTTSCPFYFQPQPPVVLPWWRDVDVVAGWLLETWCCTSLPEPVPMTDECWRTTRCLFGRWWWWFAKRATNVHHPGWEKIAGYLFKFLFKFMTAIYI